MTRLAMTMQILTRCARCGALTEADWVDGGSRGGNHYVPCAATTKTCVNGTIYTGTGCEVTVLCPDCMGQLKKWLAGGPEDPQKPQASTDSVGKLVRDMARVFCCMHAGTQPFACWYFDHVKCDGCPAYGHDHGCDQEMYNDIGRRASAFGINLMEGTEDEK